MCFCPLCSNWLPDNCMPFNVCWRKKLWEMMSAVACGLAVAHVIVIMTKDIIPTSLHRHQSHQKLLKENLSAHTLRNHHQLYNCKPLFDHLHLSVLAEMCFPLLLELWQQLICISWWKHTHTADLLNEGFPPAEWIYCRGQRGGSGQSSVTLHQV